MIGVFNKNKASVHLEDKTPMPYSFLAMALFVCHVQILLLLDKVIKESRM